MILKQSHLKALMISIGIIAAPLASAMESEKILKTSWFDDLKNNYFQVPDKQMMEADPVFVDDVWKIIIPYMNERDLNLQSFATNCLVSKKFNAWAIESLTHLDLISQICKNKEHHKYRPMTYLAYLLGQKIPKRFPNLQFLSMDLSFPGEHDDSELGQKLSKPEDYVDLNKTCGFFSIDSRLNSLSLVESAQKYIAPQNITNEDDVSVGDVFRFIATLSAEAYKVNRIRGILDIPSVKDAPLIEVPNPHRDLIKTSILGFFKELPKMTALSIIPNWYFSTQSLDPQNKSLIYSFLKNLPELHHLEFIDPPYRGDLLNEGALILDNLILFKNLSNLTTLNLCSFNRVTCFEGWGEAFNNLINLTVCLEGSAFGHSKKMEESLVTNLPNLQSLHFIQSCGDILPRIQELKYLNTFGFINSAINDDDLAQVSKMITVTTLRLIRIVPFKAHNANCQSRDVYSKEALENLRKKRPDLTIVVLNEGPLK